jgi:hypothetical protein
MAKWHQSAGNNGGVKAKYYHRNNNEKNEENNEGSRTLARHRAAIWRIDALRTIA